MHAVDILLGFFQNPPEVAQVKKKNKKTYQIRDIRDIITIHGVHILYDFSSPSYRNATFNISK